VNVYICFYLKSNNHLFNLEIKKYLLIKLYDTDFEFNCLLLTQNCILFELI
jgi:hypothetical protein